MKLSTLHSDSLIYIASRLCWLQREILWKYKACAEHIQFERILHMVNDYKMTQIGHCVHALNIHVCNWLQCSMLQQHNVSSFVSFLNNTILCPQVPGLDYNLKIVQVYVKSEYDKSDFVTSPSSKLYSSPKFEYPNSSKYI